MPPSQFENGSTAAYVGLILAGTVLIGLLPPWLFLKFRKPSWKMPSGGVVMSAAATTPRAAPADDDHRRCTGSSAPWSCVLAIIGADHLQRRQDNQEAQAKAAELTQAFEQAGLPVPADTDQIVARRWATDGGAVCDNPANALGKATCTTSSPTAPTSSAAGR